MDTLIFIDMDGTLLNEAHQILPGSQAAIRRITAMGGIRVILSSARPPRAMEKYHIQLGLRSPLICYNGALILHGDYPERFDILRSAAIAPGYLDTITEQAAQYGLTASYYHLNDWYVHTHDKWILQEEEITGTKATLQEKSWLGGLWPELDGPNKILLMGKPSDITSAEMELKVRWGKELSIYKSKDTYLEIMHPSASKKTAMEWLQHQYGLSPSNLIAIGDHFNDVEMLRYAGLGIAMGNAPEAVKAQADFVTLDHNAEGIAFALDKFFPGSALP